MAAIEVFNQHPEICIQEPPVRKLVNCLIQDEKLLTREINIVFVDDHYLKTLHQQFLDDDTFTDVMTFNLGDTGVIEGEIYISVDRAGIHAEAFGSTLTEELQRLVIHGILHLNGYDDHTELERHKMRQREDKYLQKYNRMLLIDRDDV